MCPFQSGFRDFDDIGFSFLWLEDRDVDLFSESDKLVDGGRTIQVAGDEERASPFFSQVQGELSAPFNPTRRM